MEAKFFTIIILEIGNSLLKSKTIFQIFCNSNHITIFASASFIVSLHLPLQLILAYLFLWNFTIQCSSMITLCWFWRIWISICDDYVIINFSSYFTSSLFVLVIWIWIKIRKFILFLSMFWPEVIIFNYLLLLETI